MKIKHMNQLEIAQNEIWTPRRFSTIRYHISYSALYPRQQLWINCDIHREISLRFPLSCHL